MCRYDAVPMPATLQRRLSQTVHQWMFMKCWSCSPAHQRCVPFPPCPPSCWSVFHLVSLTLEMDSGKSFYTCECLSGKFKVWFPSCSLPIPPVMISSGSFFSPPFFLTVLSPGTHRTLCDVQSCRNVDEISEMSHIITKINHK